MIMDFITVALIVALADGPGLHYSQDPWSPRADVSDSGRAQAHADAHRPSPVSGIFLTLPVRSSQSAALPETVGAGLQHAERVATEAFQLMHPEAMNSFRGP